MYWDILLMSIFYLYHHPFVITNFTISPFDDNKFNALKNVLGNDYS